ncbi:MAG: heme exporter protein CcmB [Pseudomonadota bacterium]
MRRAAWALLRRDLTLALRAGGGAGQGLAFFLIVTLLVPFGVGPNPDVLARVAPGTLWIGALLAALLSLDRMFQADFEDGTLDILSLSALPLEGLVTIKALAHWLTTGVPLTVIAPVLAITLNLPPAAFGWLVASLGLGTLGLSFLGAFGAALTMGLRRGGLILSVLVLPLYIPTLIFGARAVSLAADGGDPLAALALLAGLTLFTLALAPFATAMALRVQLT